VNVFYVSIRTTENYGFDKIRTAGVTGNATNYKNSQGDNPVCSTRDEISHPSRPFSPRAATVWEYWERRAVPAKLKNTSSNEKTESQKYTNKQQNKKTKS